MHVAYTLGGGSRHMALGRHWATRWQLSTPPRVKPPEETVVTPRDAQPQIAQRLSPRQYLRLILDGPPGSSRGSTVCAVFLIVSIFVAVVNFFLSTVPELASSNEVWAVEISCSVIFTFELLLRLYVATLDLKTYLLDPTLWVDAIAIVPFYVEVGLRAAGSGSSRQEDGGGLAVLQFLALMRLLRVFKLLKHYTDGKVLLIALSDSGRALLVPGFAMFMSVLLLSGAMIVVEQATEDCRHDEPDSECEGFRD